MNLDPELIAKLPKEQRTQALKSSICYVYRQSLYHLAKYGLGYSDITWSTHGDMIRALESGDHRKLLCVPRGCFKSSLAAVAYPIWRLIRNANLRILIDSELYTNSATFLREIRAHLMGEKMTSLFGAFKNDANWNEGEITILQRNRPKKESSITCGGIGTTKVGQHYDIIIGDDYNSPKNTMTPEGRKKVIDHVRYNTSILEPDGTYVFTATRYHEEDVTGFILKDLIGMSVEQALARPQVA